MNISRNSFFRFLAFIAVIAVLKFSFSSFADDFKNGLDLRAALLVFVMPIFVLLLFQKQNLNFRQLFLRAKEISALDTATLRQQFKDEASGAVGPYSHSNLLKLTSDHPDSFVRYAGELVRAQFDTQELSSLLSQRIESEDLFWTEVSETFGFMAKMAPYFGMLATVIGMVKLLENMNDLSRISGSMALAMQGTLYGLISFTLIYSPLLKMLSGWRDRIRGRNEMVAHWFILVASKAESAYIREDLKSSSFSTQEPEGVSLSIPAAGQREPA